MTTAKKTADTVLRKPKTIKIGRRTVTCKPITLSAFVAISGITAYFPQVNEALERTDDEILSFVLTEAKRYNALSDMIAILALGQPKKDTFWKRWKRQRLSDYIASKVPAVELGSILNELLDGMAIAHFFQCTASLSELNLLKEKRKTAQFGVR